MAYFLAASQIVSAKSHPSSKSKSSKTITIGLSEPTAGPEAALASYGYGMEAYFDQADAQGGFNGLKVKLDIFNDDYNPAEALSNAERAVQQDHVFAFTGIGIPENAARTYLNKAHVPQVFVDSADVTFARPPSSYPWSRAWLMQIGAEGYIDAHYELAHASNPKLCTIALAGSLASELQAGVKQAVSDAGRGSVVANVTYSIDEPNVDSEILQLRQAGCTAVVANLAGAGASLAPAYLGTIGWHPTLFLMSANVSRLTMEAQGQSNYKGVYSALTMMDPADPKYAKSSAIRAYDAAIKKYAPSGTEATDTTAFLGYTAGEAFGFALEHMSGVSGKALLKSIDAMTNVTLPGLLPKITLDSGPGGRLMFDAQISQFNGSEWTAVGSVQSALKVGLVGYEAGLAAS